ncbi:cadherin-like domain-containing protein [Methylobacterium sp. 37f]|uniref:calcium-binding protein n=1 Tax=Methylobacterium sp. 37f TaxID=2817058 RepID=UPI001FFD1DDD|nr:cadherin-like domain-containing protein [Methylobacterium sp. 37f]MCK2053068.1 cadherin-like domain-containing protein [Methylobacterium sp. 37f]
MIIETKGTKTGDAAQTGAQTYAPKVAAKSSPTPYYLALAVAALAGYLKSLFHTSVQAEVEPSVAGHETKAAPKLIVIASSDVDSDEPPAEHRLVGSSGIVPQAETPAPEYDATHFPAHTLHFARHDPQPNLSDFKASPIIPRPINDNADQGPGVRGGGGGGRDKGHGDEGTGSDSADNPAARPPGGLGGEDLPGGGEDLPGVKDKPPAEERPSGQDTSGPGKSTGIDGDRGVGPGDPSGGAKDTGDGSGAVTPRPVSNDDGDGSTGRRNRAPTTSGTVQLADMAACALLPIALADLLRNAEDPDGDSLSVRNVTVSSGALTRDGDGWVYDADDLGPVTVTYEVTDGELSVTQTAVFNVVEHEPMVGTDGDDLLLGTLCADEIDGRGGNDIIDARAAADIIDGGAGDDHILGGAGDDVILGGDGNDVVFAGVGADRVSGGNGNDRIFGEEGDDILFGDAGDDLLDGGEGSDILVGGTGNDLLLGDRGDDRLDGSEGADVAFGGAGRDVILGGLGDDRLEGGDDADVLSDGRGRDVVSGQDGDDVLVAALDGEADLFEGGAGTDTLDLAGVATDVVVDLAAGTAVGQEIGRDTVASIEVVQAGVGNDVLIGSSQGDTLMGGAGRDTVSGGAGDDLVDGGSGDDTLADGAGSDTVLGGAGDDLVRVALDGEADIFDGGAGTDTLDLSGTRTGIAADLLIGIATGAETGRGHLNGLEALIGGSGDDTLSGSDGSNRLTGGEGHDLIAGRGGDDVLEGGAGCDTLLDGAGRDTLHAGAGDDRIVLALDGDADLVDGGAGSDTLDLSSATGDLLVDLVNHVVSGTELGHDKVESIERIVSGSGDDRFVVGEDDVVLTGGGGTDGYVFLARTGMQETTRSVQITDFSVGDYVDLLKWSLFEKGASATGHSLSEAMDRDDGTVSGIRYRAALFDEGDATVISADLDGDDSFETTLVLDGHHTLLFVEKTAAATQPSAPIH